MRRHQHRFSYNVIHVRHRSVAHHFFFFENPFPRNAQFVNLKNPDLDLIQRIHPECGFYGFMIRFWIRKSGSGFSQKNAPSVSIYEHITFIIHDHSKYFSVSDWLKYHG